MCRTPLGNNREIFAIGGGSRWPFAYEAPVDDVPGYLPFPFELAYAAALLERDPSVELFVRDCIGERDFEPGFLKMVFDFKPNVVVIETAMVKLDGDIRLAAAIRAKFPEVDIIFCGNLEPEYFDQLKEQVDFLMLKEYPMNLLNLVRCIRTGKPTNQVPSLVRFKPTFEQNFSYVEIDAGQLPWPARQYFPLQVYKDGFIQLRPFGVMLASRGCPFKCAFCAPITVNFNAGNRRDRNPVDICNEMEYLVEKHGVREIYMDGDTETGSKSAFLAMCREIKRRGLEKRTKWSIMGDFMVTDSEMLHAAADAGMIGMKVGLESASPKVLKGINKPVKLERFEQNAELCYQLGIKTHGTITFGHPDDTVDTLNETLEFMKRSPLATWQVSVVTPFPGTPLYHRLKAAGRMKGERGQDFNGNGKCIIDYPPESGLSTEYVEEFHVRAFQEWKRHKLKDPKWVKFHLRLVARAMWSNPGIIVNRFQQTTESWTRKAVKATTPHEAKPPTPPPAPALAGS